jgi:hypothetical protein
MTKDQFSELLTRVCSGGILNSDLAKRFDKGMIKGLCNLAYQQIIAELYKSAYKTANFSQFTQFTKPYKEPVLFDDFTEEYYCRIPVVIIQLPNDAAIRSISSTKDKNYTMVHEDISQGASYSTQFIRKVLTKPVFYVQGDRIVWEKDKWNKNFKDVLIKLIPDLSVYDDDDEIGIPAEDSFDTFTIIKKIVGEMPASKPTIDNTTKQP